MKNFYDIFIFTVVGLLMITGWNYFYVVPADKFRYQMISCMNDIKDNSIKGYNICKSQLKTRDESR